MNVEDAAYHTVHDYPGGCRSLAPRVEINQAVLQNKVNPSQATHKLTLAEAVRIQAVTGDARILHAMADEMGFICIAVPQFDGISDVELLNAYAQVISSSGRFAQNFNDALADGKITVKEYEGLRQDVYRVQQHESELLARIESLVEE